MISCYLCSATYQAGIENLFKIYMPIVDYWMLVENQSNHRIRIATGALDGEVVVINQELYNKILGYVK